MKIFAVKKNYQETDTDCWNHWLESNVISYHKTKELADNKIASLISDKAYDSHLIWDTELGDTRNILTYSTGCNLDGPFKRVNLFFNVEIEVEE